MTSVQIARYRTQQTTPIADATAQPRILRASQLATTDRDHCGSLVRMGTQLGVFAVVSVHADRSLLVADTASGRVYRVELDLFVDVEYDVDALVDCFREEFDPTDKHWATHGHLKDPTFAAALRAYSAAVRQVLRLKPSDFHVGGCLVVRCDAGPTVEPKTGRPRSDAGSEHSSMSV